MARRDQSIEEALAEIDLETPQTRRLTRRQPQPWHLAVFGEDAVAEHRIDEDRMRHSCPPQKSNHRRAANGANCTIAQTSAIKSAPATIGPAVLLNVTSHLPAAVS